MRKVCLIFLVFISISKSNSQGNIIWQIGRVVFGSGIHDKDSLREKEYAFLINQHIERNYPKRKLLFIYLDVSSKEDSIPFELAYDNLRGNSLENKIYDGKHKDDIPGLRIKIYSKELRKEELLRLLDYGIVNIKELKKIRRKALKKSRYDQPDTLSISQEKIARIIKTNP